MITVVGDVMLDVFLLSELQEAEQGSGLVFRPGGSAANTACWLAKLGQRVSFVGCSGGDALGQALAAEIAGHGVLMHAHHIEEKETGGVAIQIVHDGERVMRSSRGANEALSPEHILSAARFEPAYIHLSGYSLLGPYGLEILWAAHQLAVACESVLALDPSSKSVIRQFTATRLLQALADNKVGLLLLNREEAQELTGELDAERAANILAGTVDGVVVKEGKDGSVWSDGDSWGRLRTYPIVPLDTTGAGDAFNAGVLSGLVNGEGLNEACINAQQCASQVLERFGGRP